MEWSKASRSSLGPSERKKVETDYAVSELNDYHRGFGRILKFESVKAQVASLFKLSWRNSAALEEWNWPMGERCSFSKPRSTPKRRQY